MRKLSKRCLALAAAALMLLAACAALLISMPVPPFKNFHFGTHPPDTFPPAPGKAPPAPPA